MTRHLVERTFPDGLGIPTDDGGAKACPNVVDGNAEHGVTWVHPGREPGHKTHVLRLRRPVLEAIRMAAETNGSPVDAITEVRVPDPGAPG